MNSTECIVSARIKRISNALDRRVTLELEDMDLTSSQGMILGYLHRRRGEDVYPVDIGKHFGLSHPTVTGLLQRLEAKGFLTYCSDSTDRRKKRICLTERAEDCHQRIHGRFAETEAMLTKAMTPEELAVLTELLDRMLEKLDAGCAACGCRIREGDDD